MSVWECSSTALGALVDALLGDRDPARAKDVYDELCAEIAAVDAESVVFNWECCSGCNDAGFVDTALVMRTGALLLAPGHLLMFSDFGLGAAPRALWPARPPLARGVLSRLSDPAPTPPRSSPRVPLAARGQRRPRRTPLRRTDARPAPGAPARSGGVGLRGGPRSGGGGVRRHRPRAALSPAPFTASAPHSRRLPPLRRRSRRRRRPSISAAASRRGVARARRRGTPPLARPPCEHRAPIFTGAHPWRRPPRHRSRTAPATSRP